jgi:predicted DNA-binding transcriptional regulator AlpA
MCCAFWYSDKDEAAEIARISRRQLDFRIKAGAGPAVTKIGGFVRIRDDELQAWLERCTIPPPSHSTAAA